VVAGDRGNARVLSQKLHQVLGVQRGIRAAAVHRRKPPLKLALQNVLNGTPAILEYVVMNDYIPGADDRHSYFHSNPQSNKREIRKIVTGCWGRVRMAQARPLRRASPQWQ
jgi:hypothetical protein